MSAVGYDFETPENPVSSDADQISISDGTTKNETRVCGKTHSERSSLLRIHQQNLDNALLAFKSSVGENLRVIHVMTIAAEEEQNLIKSFREEQEEYLEENRRLTKCLADANYDNRCWRDREATHVKHIDELKQEVTELKFKLSAMKADNQIDEMNKSASLKVEAEELSGCGCAILIALLIVVFLAVRWIISLFQ